ncbi:DUF192 domain-containing protein [Roseibium sp. M-1]
MFRQFLSAACVVATLFLGIAGASGPLQAQEPQTGLAEEALVITSGETQHKFTAEIAADDRQRAFGLMFREEMAEDRGMLFLFDGAGDRYFWMKNTPLPLDIIFIDAGGTIVSIAEDTTPFSESVIPSNGPAKYVFEVNAGVTEKLGIAAGDRVMNAAMGLE